MDALAISIADCSNCFREGLGSFRLFFNDIDKLIRVHFS